MNQEAVAELFHGIKGYHTLVKIPKTIDIEKGEKFLNIMREANDK